MTFDEEVYEYAKSRNGTNDSRMTDRMLAYRAGAESKEKKIKELEMLVQKLKCCENCKHHGFMGNELICHLENYDTEFECLKTGSHWELDEE